MKISKIPEVREYTFADLKHGDVFRKKGFNPKTEDPQMFMKIKAVHLRSGFLANAVGLKTSELYEIQSETVCVPYHNAELNLEPKAK